MRTLKAIWPIHQSELNVDFLRSLRSLSCESIGQLALVMLPEGESFPALRRREGLAAVQARLARALSLKELLGGDVSPVKMDYRAGRYESNLGQKG